MGDRILRWIALPFLRRLRDEQFLSDYQCELLRLAPDPGLHEPGES